jgi:single-strand DNA-binding protein
MPGFQHVTILGHLGRDPELRHTPSGAAVATFSVAVSRRWTGSDGQPEEETEWFSVVTWNKLAEACNQYLRKGSLAHVVGRLKTRAWEGPDGQRLYRTELVAEGVQFLSRAPAAVGAGSGGDAEPGPDDGPPF